MTAIPHDGGGAARTRARIARPVGLGCAAGALALAGVLGGFGLFVASLEEVERAPSERADGIVVLTGGSQRVEDAIDLLARGYAGRLLITGVNERTGRDEISRLTPGQRELVECCVDLDYRARNTVGNAAETRRWARERKFGSLIVVTSNYHLPRTLAELDRVLPEVRKVPYAVVPTPTAEGWSAALVRTRRLFSEYAKFVVVWLRTRVVAPDPEAASVGAARSRAVADRGQAR